MVEKIAHDPGAYDLTGTVQEIYERLFTRPLEARMPFAREEFPPVHAVVVPGDMPIAGGAIRIDGEWTITCSPELALYADDLRACLAVGYGLWLGDGAGGCITLRIDASLVPQAHRITVAAGCIEVAGGDAAGVMYGVHRLEERVLLHAVPALEIGTEERTPALRTRIYRSFAAPYYIEEARTGEEYYPDAYLDRLAHHGFNGIWVHATLRDCARSPLFPTYGAQAAENVAYLQQLIARAAQYHIGVYLYMTEPLGMAEDDPLWAEFPRLRGAQSRLDRSYALCTSQPEVRAHVQESVAGLARQLPGLGGVIQISASEHHHHCWSHVDARCSLGEWHKAPTCECPRCGDRLPQEVVAEVIGLVHAGLRAGAPDARHIVWNWSWAMYEEDPQRGILERLPNDVIVMGDFERGTAVEKTGARFINEEYSLSIVGPSPRFQGLAEACRARGLQHLGRIQIPVTHETPTLPAWPVYGKLAEKVRRLADGGAAGTMSCWNFGNFLGLATEIADRMSWHPLPALETVLPEVAARHFGVEAAPEMLRAWALFDAASELHPLAMPFLYLGPLSRCPGLPLFMKPTGQPMAPSYMLSPLGDRIADYLAPFTAETVCAQLRALDTHWQAGVAALEQAGAQVRDAFRPAWQREYAIAAFFGCQVRSAANFTEFIHRRDTLAAGDTDPRLREIMRDELEVCRQALACIRVDARIGFHGEAQAYLVTPADIAAKIAQLERVLMVP